MSIASDFMEELDYELPATRRLLERIPDEKGAWKPHPKSSAFGHLAQLVSRLPGTMADIVRGTDLDLATSPPYTYESAATLQREFDSHVRDLIDALKGAAEDVFALTWNLRYGEEIVGSGTRQAVLRNTINHFVHHRGQLTVYLRLNDIPVPSLYGPTADET